MKDQATYPTTHMRAGCCRGIMEAREEGEHLQISESTYTSRCQGKSTKIRVSKYGSMILARKYPADEQCTALSGDLTILAC